MYKVANPNAERVNEFGKAIDYNGIRDLESVKTEEDPV